MLRSHCGLNYILTLTRLSILNPKHLMQWYLEMGTLGVIKFRGHESGTWWWALCPYKKRHQRGWLLSFHCVVTQQEGSHLQARKHCYQKPTMQASWSQTSSLQNSEKINVCCLSHPTFCHGSLSKPRPLPPCCPQCLALCLASLVWLMGWAWGCQP